MSQWQNLPDSQGDARSRLSLAATATVCSIANLPGGVYDVSVQTWQAGVTDGLGDNMQLQHGSTVVGRLLSMAIPVSERFPRVTIADGETLSVITIGVTGVGSLYNASIVATRMV